MSKIWTFGDSFTAGHGCKYVEDGTFSKDSIDNYYRRTYKDYIVDDKFIWNEIVSNTLSMELVDLSVNGSSTETIFDTLLKHTTFINKDDIVIIQTSTVGRYDFPFLKEKSLIGCNTSQYRRDDTLFSSFDSPYFFKTIFVNNFTKEYDAESESVLQYINAQSDLKNNSLKLNKFKYDTIRNFFHEFLLTEKYYERSVWKIVQFSNLLKSIGITSYILNEDIWPTYLPKPQNLIEMHPKGMLGYVVQSGKTIHSDTNGRIKDWHPSYDGHIDIANFILNFIKNEDTDLHNA